MDIFAYQYDKYYFFWKPHGVPSTFGKEKSFLDSLEESSNIVPPETEGTPFRDKEGGPAGWEVCKNLINPSLQLVTNLPDIIKNQISTFGKDKEYWLLNRLDNDTAGFLYFAKDVDTFDRYRHLQSQNHIEKHYIAQVFGSVLPLLDKGGVRGGFVVDFPIMHRSAEKMIAITDPKLIIKGRWQQHHVQTFVETLNYDPQTNISTLLVKIHKGIRHQIRVHLASVGFPIIGDPLYGENVRNDILHLRSIWFTIVE